MAAPIVFRAISGPLLDSAFWAKSAPHSLFHLLVRDLIQAMTIWSWPSSNILRCSTSWGFLETWFRASKLSQPSKTFWSEAGRRSAYHSNKMTSAYGSSIIWGEAAVKASSGRENSLNLRSSSMIVAYPSMLFISLSMQKTSIPLSVGHLGEATVNTGHW